MTEDRRAKKQTALLAPLGTIPSGELNGQPIFQFKRASVYMVDRRKPDSMSQTDSGLWIPKAQEWERVHQFSATDNRWSIGKWTPPSYTQEEFMERFGFLLDYPRNGWWWLYLPLEYLPDEEWTQWFCEQTLKQMSSTVDDHMYNMREYHREKREKGQTEIAELTKDNFVNHLPGKRGGVVSYPRTRFDR